MNNTHYLNTTLQYYESWLGKSRCLSDGIALQYIYTNERNIKQAGYSSCSDLYIWIQPNKSVISYGDAALPEINKLKQTIIANVDINELSSIINNVYGVNVNHNIKYVFYELQNIVGKQPKTLTEEDYTDYERFFLDCFPGSDISWLKEYFDYMVELGYCVGIYENSKITSCTDAPSMPYMFDKVQEIGINTISQYQGKGYASTVCIKAAENILNSGKVPQWSTTINNIASQRLAEKVGFIKLSDVFTITMR